MAGEEKLLGIANVGDHDLLRLGLPLLVGLPGGDIQSKRILWALLL
jgi:hypothetical protein